MKTRISLLLLIFPFWLLAQSITFRILDENNLALSNVIVEVEISESENLLLETNQQGEITLEKPSTEQITIYIKSYGYQMYQNTFRIIDLQHQLNITLKIDETIQLNEVKLTPQKPLIKRKIDRLEFNIDQTSLQNLSAWDILKNTPQIILKNDQLSVRGNTQILITIDDRKIMMSQEELRQLLENTEGSTIATVEVITNPPAKYEASGSAIIKIKTKKNILLGYKGQLYARYHQSYFTKGMIGTSHSYNKNKWQLNGSYYFVNGKYYRSNYDVTTYEITATRWESDMKRKTTAKEQHIYNFASLYKIDSLQHIQFGINGYNNPASIGNYNVPTKIFSITSNQLESNYFTSNHRKEFSNSVNGYLVYEKKINDNTLNWTNNLTYRRYKENQHVVTLLNFIHQPETQNQFKTDAQQDLKLYATQIDYGINKEKYGLEFGAKYSFVTNNNALDFYEYEENYPTYQPLKSNTFDYNEQILAFYISGNHKWKNWETKAGLRSESTWITTKSNTLLHEQNRKNTHIFPTFYLMYSLDNDAQIGLNYGKRIARPNYNFLNPSKSYYNLFSYFQGDANAFSTLIHNLSLTYTYKNWNFEAYYRYEKNPAMEISIQNHETFETVYYFTNIKNGEALGWNISKNFEINAWWKFNIFAMSELNSNYFLGTNQQPYQNQVLFYNINLNTQLELDKKKTFNLAVGYVYNSKSIQASYDISASQNLYVILNKKFWDKKIELGIILNDILKTDRNTIKTNYADQNQYFKDYRDTQYFMMNLRYNFGNQKVKDVKNIEKIDEQSRI